MHTFFAVPVPTFKALIFNVLGVVLVGTAKKNVILKKSI